MKLVSVDLHFLYPRPFFLQFANLASGSEDLEVGSDLISCTSECQLSKPFTVDGRKVVLVDTPGFNDTEMSDTKVLRMIAAFLERTYA